MRKKYFFIAGMALLCLAGWGFYQYERPRASLTNKTTDVTIDAVDMFNQYQKDEVASNKHFLDKIIQVKGKLVDVQQTDTTMSIELKGGEMGGINCSIKTGQEKMVMPSIGSSITIKGLCTGYLMDVNLVDCILKK